MREQGIMTLQDFVRFSRDFSKFSEDFARFSEDFVKFCEDFARFSEIRETLRDDYSKMSRMQAA